MAVFWPRPENTYDASQQKTKKFSAGLNKYQITVPYYSEKLNLRLDPDSKRNTLLIKQLSFTRAGGKTVLNPESIAKNILAVSTIQWNLSPDGLKMVLESNDPMLIFKSLPFSVSTTFWLIPLLTFLVLATLFRWLSKRSSTRSGISIFLIFVGLATLYWLESSTLQQDQFLLLFINALPVFAIVKLIILFEQSSGEDSYIKYFSPLLLIAVFILFMMGQLYLSLTPEIITSIKNSTENAFLENRDKGLNFALKKSRDAFENIFTENLQQKKKLIILNAESKIFILGFSLSEKAILGKDNWFFEGYGERRVEKDIVQSFDNITDYMGQNPFTEKELEAWKVTLEERYYWLKEKGSKYIFVLAPTKALVYPEKLPERILRMKNKYMRPTRYDQLIKYLNEKSIVPVVDLRKAMLEAKDKHKDVPLFYRTDFHWNYFGSFMAYRAIIGGINQAYPEFNLVAGELDEFNVHKKTDWAHVAFMKMVGLEPQRHQNDTYFTLHPKPESDYFKIASFSEKGINDYSMPKYTKRNFGKYTYPVREYINPNGKLPLMYIIGDSFIEKTLAYFSLHNKETLNFRAITNIPPVPFSDAAMKPDIVVQEILNMYLLRQPPSNPMSIKKARKRALQNNSISGD
ncbi:MAG: hypothetical protein KAJ95_00560 [Gammaproteobacteria bacterium]|nr:hypothetical protein [Gammaproteobacteria bacterium]